MLKEHARIGRQLRNAMFVERVEGHSVSGLKRLGERTVEFGTSRAQRLIESK
jgi:hypothetical protein